MGSAQSRAQFAEPISAADVAGVRVRQYRAVDPQLLDRVGHRFSLLKWQLAALPPSVRMKAHLPWHL